MTEEHGGLIVVGDDGSAAADIAWLWLNSQVWPGWSVDVVTADAVVGPDQMPTRDVKTVERPVVEAARFAALRHLHESGDARLVLNRRQDADLLVIGAEPRSTTTRLWKGSAAHWLLQHPPAPTILVRSGAPTRRVVVCADGSPHVDRATRTLGSLPWSDGLEVVALAVDEGAFDVDAALDATAAALPRCQVTRRVVAGRPTRAIVSVLAETSADLVVLGTRGLTGWQRLRLGSTAGSVAHHAPCSALLAHQPNATS